MLIDEITVDRARNADLISLLERRRGFTFVLRGGAYRCREHPSLAVKDDRRSWYWHSKGMGGHGAVDYLMKAENMPFREAVETASGIGAAQHRVNLALSAEPPKTLILPEKRGIPLRLYDYLCVKRGIDGNIVNTLIQKETLYEDRRGNVVFVGHDERGKARFASLRGTYGDCYFRGDCAGSDKRYGFSMAFSPADQLYVYESPIDAMSHASMDNAFRSDKDAWKRRSRLSLAGTSDAALPFFLNRHTAVRELVFCLDNDSAGQEASRALSRKYAEKGFYVRIEPPYRKDFNDDLQAFREQTQAEKRANKRHRDVSI